MPDLKHPLLQKREKWNVKREMLIYFPKGNQSYRYSWAVVNEGIFFFMVILCSIVHISNFPLFVDWGILVLAIVNSAVMKIDMQKSSQHSHIQFLAGGESCNTSSFSILMKCPNILYSQTGDTQPHLVGRGTRIVLSSRPLWATK